MKFIFLLLVVLAPWQTTPPIDRILFIGNSITYHAPDTELDWPYSWGMAATQADKDWVHRVQLGIAERQGLAPEIRIIQTRADVLAEEMQAMIREWEPDWVIVQTGDNASTEWLATEWQRQYSLVAASRTIALGIWYPLPGDVRPERQREGALAAGVVFVPISDIHTPATEAQAVDDCTAGVCWHPNDRGMAMIAGRILAAIYSQSTYLPLVRGEGGTVPPPAK